MNLLKKYYNERFKESADPAFEDLTEEQKKGLSSTYGFACWKAYEALKNFGRKAEGILPLNFKNT